MKNAQLNHRRYLLRNRIAMATVLTMILGCAGAPRDEAIEAAYYGPAITQPAERIRAAMSEVLKDPYSAIFGGPTTPRRGWVARALKDTEYGWIVHCSINAKNSYGGYAGSKRYSFLFRDDVLVVLWNENDEASRDVYGSKDLKWGYSFEETD